MPSTLLATVPQFGAYLKTTFDPNDATATLYLQIASGMVRDFLQRDLTAVAGDVVLVDPIDGSYGLLPELPISAVSLVETFDGTVWTTMTPSTYTVSTRLGMIAGKPGTGATWPTDPATWRVTYSHGFAEVPDSIVGVTLGVAARAYASEPGVDLERIGGYQVKYAGVAADGFSPIELKALARYVLPRVA